MYAVYLTYVFIAIACTMIGKVIIDKGVGRKWVWWLIVTIGVVAVHYAYINAHVFVRMIALCSTMLAGMKLVVYQAWIDESKTNRLSSIQWAGFTYLWIGMDPTPWKYAFVERKGDKRNINGGVGRRAKAWRKDVLVGSLCMLVGVTSVYVTYRSGWQHVIILFITMSVAFHYGALRLLVAFWRWRGVTVRSLFRNPLITKGFTDFWAKRWNLAYSHMMARCVQRPLTNILGKKSSVFCVFVISGLLHEVAITVPVQSGYGLPTCFFIVQGGLTILAIPNVIVGRALCLSSLLLGLPILFPYMFRELVMVESQQMLGIGIDHFIDKLIGRN